MTSSTGLSGQAVKPGDPASAALELLRDEYVRQGFAALDVLERLDPGPARRLLKDRLEAEAQRAAALPVLPKPAGVSDFNYSIMIKETNHTRVRRVLDFVITGDRILEIGVGFGYITGMLLRETAIDGYCGIDLTDRQIAAARQMAEIHRARPVPIHLEVKNLYDLTPEWVGNHDPDLVLLLEVLEHVPDAEKALSTLADCVRDDAAILFSVPTHGRLETVWGHVSIFDSERVQSLCKQAGLIAQHVEIVQDQWVFVLATKSRSVPRRLFEILGRSPSPGSPAAPVIHEFAPIPAESITLSARSPRKATLEHLDDGLVITRRRSHRPGKDRGVGVQFPVAGDVRLRLELSFQTPSNIERVRVYLRGAGGKSTAQWIWDCNKEPTGKKTFVLRPGRRFGPFRSFGVATLSRAKTAEVVVEAKSTRKELSFTLHRLAVASERTNAPASTDTTAAATGTDTD